MLCSPSVLAAVLPRSSGEHPARQETAQVTQIESLQQCEIWLNSLGYTFCFQL